MREVATRILKSSGLQNAFFDCAIEVKLKRGGYNCSVNSYDSYFRWFKRIKNRNQLSSTRALSFQLLNRTLIDKISILSIPPSRITLRCDLFFCFYRSLLFLISRRNGKIFLELVFILLYNILDPIF